MHYCRRNVTSAPQATTHPRARISSRALLYNPLRCLPSSADGRQPPPRLPPAAGLPPFSSPSDPMGHPNSSIKELPPWEVKSSCHPPWGVLGWAPDRRRSVAELCSSAGCLGRGWAWHGLALVRQQPASASAPAAPLGRRGCSGGGLGWEGGSRRRRVLLLKRNR
eukprot:scaffold90272_cov26-Tisochrysis_lutea.AAC.1